MTSDTDTSSGLKDVDTENAMCGLNLLSAIAEDQGSLCVLDVCERFINRRSFTLESEFIYYE